MYTESGEKEASKRRRTKRRGTTEEREFQTKAATMCAKIVERSARREISAERGGRTAEITLKRKNGTQESETATQSTAGGVLLHLKSSGWLEVFSPWCLRAAEKLQIMFPPLFGSFHVLRERREGAPGGNREPPPS